MQLPYDSILRSQQRGWNLAMANVALILVVVVSCWFYVGLFDRARLKEGVVFLDLARTTHFEVVDEVVWAHAQGRFQTLWKALAEVEAAFPAAGLLRVHRHLLVRPETILGIRPLWGGRLTVTLPGGVELESSRGATAVLKNRLGLA